MPLELALYGIGVHHAGLGMDDRRATEELYLNRKLRIVIATSVSGVIHELKGRSLTVAQDTRGGSKLAYVKGVHGRDWS